MILSSCVSRFLHLLWRVMISLTPWVSLSGFEGTHLFSNIEVHLLYPWCSSLLSCLFWEVFFLPHVSLLTWNKLKWFRAGSLISSVKMLIVILHVPHCWFPQGKQHRCLDGNKICNIISCEKHSSLWNLHVVETPTSIPTSGKWLYLCLLFS